MTTLKKIRVDATLKKIAGGTKVVPEGWAVTVTVQPSGTTLGGTL